MSLRAPQQTIEALRLTLDRLEQSTDPTPDAQEMAELKCILLTRIAELEAVNAFYAESSVTETPDNSLGAPNVELPPVEVVEAEEAVKELSIQPN